MTTKRDYIFDFELGPSYIKDRSFLAYRKVRESGVFPKLSVTTKKGYRKSKPFDLVYEGDIIKVYLDSQGHLRSGNNDSLHNWFDTIRPQSGDVVRFFTTDTDFVYQIELIRKDTFVPIPSAKIDNQPEIKGTLSDIQKLFDLMNKGIINSTEYSSLKIKLLAEIKPNLNNIESFHELKEKGVISEQDFNTKKEALISILKRGDISAKSSADTAIHTEISPKLIKVKVPDSFYTWGGFSLKGDVKNDFPDEKEEISIETPSTKPYAAHRSQQSRIYVENWDELVNELGIKPMDWLLIEIIEPNYLYRIVKVLHKS